MVSDRVRFGVGRVAVGAFALGFGYQLLDSAALRFVSQYARSGVATAVAFFAIVVGGSSVAGYRLYRPGDRSSRPSGSIRGRTLAAVGGCGALGRLAGLLLVPTRGRGDLEITGFVVLAGITGVFLAFGWIGGNGLARAVAGRDVLDGRLATVAGIASVLAGVATIAGPSGTVADSLFHLGIGGWFFAIAWFVTRTGAST